MSYYSVVNGVVHRKNLPPPGAKPLKHNLKLLLPPLITELHQALRAWGTVGVTPGPLLAKQIYFNQGGDLAIYLDAPPSPLLQVGLAPTLAAWFVLLDKWMETYVVLARARTVWSVAELCGALTFLTPAFLPAKLINHPPDNWERVAQALAIIIADDPLAGTPTDRHWQR